MTNLGPILRRELRITARAPGTYRSRVIAGSMALIVCISLATSGTGQLAAYFVRNGNAMFTGLSQIIFALTAVIGAVATADCLSREKREGTLGLLLLTPLRPWDIVLSKLLTNMLPTTLFLMTIVPIFFLPLILGRVGAGQVLQVMLVLGNTLFFCLALGLMASAWSKVESKAMGFAMMLQVFIMHMLPVLIMILQKTGRTFPGMTWIEMFSPRYALTNAISGHLFFWPNLSALSFAMTHLLGWVFMAMAVLGVTLRWQDRPAKAKGENRWKAWWKASEKLGDQNPFSWLQIHERGQRLAGWILLAGVSTAILVLSAMYPTNGAPLAFMTFGFVIMTVGLKAQAGTVATAALCREQESGSMELLLTTPMTVDEIIAGQIRSSLRVLLMPFVVLVMITIIIIFTLFQMEVFAKMAAAVGVNPLVYFGVGGLIYITLTTLEMIAITSLGIYSALTAKKASNAKGASLAIMGAPVLMVVLTAATIDWLGFGRLVTEPGLFAVTLYCMYTVLVTLCVWNWSYKKIKTEFRQLAVKRFEYQEALTVWGVIRKVWKQVISNKNRKMVEPAAMPSCPR